MLFTLVSVQPSAAVASPPAAAASTAASDGSVKIQFSMVRPEIILVEDSMRTNTNALLLVVSLKNNNYVFSVCFSVILIFHVVILIKYVFCSCMYNTST